MGVVKIITKDKKEEITKENYKLIHHIAHSFKNTTGIEYDVLLSTASLGFSKALDTYKTTHNTKFSTYAYKVMKNELLLFLRKERRYRKHIILSDEVYPRE